MANRSAESLAPDNGKGVAFSFRLLGQDGKAIDCECVRTPLEATIPAGGSHRQNIQVIIPAEHIDKTTAIRVCLLQLREYWGDKINPEHPATVAISRGPDLSPAHKILAEASHLWPSGKNNTLKWPYNTMMVAEEHRLMYIPVAKCACTSLKSMMINLAGVEHIDHAIKLGVHQVTDRFNTGVQLKDKPMDRARDILASDQYVKFAVVREPFERLVSAFMEKFVHNRDSARNLLHTRPIISQVQGTTEIDLQRGISFDEFVDYILQQDSWDLDTHWRPQYLYMQGVPHMGKVFRIENLDKLAAYLEQERGIQVDLEHKNRTSKSEKILPDASTFTTDKLDSAGSISPDSFRSSVYFDQVKSYYQQDFDLYRNAG